MTDQMPPPPHMPPPVPQPPHMPPPPQTQMVPAYATASPYGAHPQVAPMPYGMVGARGPHGRLLVNGREVSSPWKRFGANLLDGLLMLVTLYIGWIVWALIVCNDGYTPARKLLNMRTVHPVTGKPANFGQMVGLRGICMILLSIFTGGLVYLGSLITAFATDKNQTVADMISSTVVIDE